jgi:hypothetical protein
MVDYHFKRGAGPPGLLVQKPGYVIVEREGGSHIMMLQSRHHDVNSADKS